MKRKSLALILGLMLALESGSISAYAADLTDDAAVVDFADDEGQEEFPEYSVEAETETDDLSGEADFLDGTEDTDVTAGTENLFSDGEQADEITVEEETAESSGISWGSSNQILSTDVTTARDGCVLIGVKGSYLSDRQGALDEINRIRKEACDEGVQDPRNPSRNLTPSDYVPIKWSADLEYIARIRAAEASVGAVWTAHNRLNGRTCWDAKSPNGMQSWGEVLAWNWSRSMITGIQQWYGEKTDWVNQTGAVTGHYTQMINPSNSYVGVASFINSNTAYFNATAGEYSSTGAVLDQSGGPAIDNCTQTVEVAANRVQGSITGLKDKIKVSEKSTADLEMSAYYSAMVPVNGITWTSSDATVASVDNKGVVTGRKAGTAVITANVEGLKFSKSITVEKVLVKPSAMTGVKITGRTSNTITLSWNKNTSASGYIIEQKQNGKWVNIKKISGNSTVTYRVENLSAGRYYDFRIKAFTWDSDTKTSMHGNYTNVTGATILPKVSGVRIGSRTSSTITLNWNRSTAASGYIIEQKQNGKWVNIKKISGNSTVTYCVEKLSAGRYYDFRVKAFTWDNTIRTSVHSDYVNVTGATTLPKVTGVRSGSRTSSTITLNWNRSTAASGYIIEQKQNGKWVNIKKISGNSTATFRVTGLNAGTKYDFRIKAFTWDSATRTSVHSGYTNISGTTLK
nr:fibronectin type III domain-containing protein [uncultured Blautia sp.]